MPDSIPSPFPKSKAQLNREKYAAQGKLDAMARVRSEPIAKRHRVFTRLMREKRPAYGSQQWAETRGDDLGLSPDC